MNCLSNKKKKAFTLIELLVVIAIIALLISILLPSLSLAKAQGKGILCRSNIRQLAIANLAYASENNNHFVAAASDLWDTNGGLLRWHGTRKTPDDAFDASKGLLSSYMGNGQVKECPEKLKFHKGLSWSQSFEKGGGGYGYYMTYLGSTRWLDEIITSIPEMKRRYARTTKTIQVAQSSETLMFTDTAYLQGENMIEYSFAEPRYWFLNGELDLSASPTPTIHFRHHNLKANVAWVDGHVSSLAMPDSYNGTNAYLESYRMHLLGMFDPVNNRLFDLK